MGTILYLLPLVVFLGVLYWNRKQPEPLFFYRLSTGGLYHTLPADFETAWAWVEEHLATRTANVSLSACPLCGRKDLSPDYRHQFTYGGFSWTRLDRTHIMFGHVKNGDDHVFHMPNSRFVSTIMHAYDNRPARAAAPAVTH